MYKELCWLVATITLAKYYYKRPLSIDALRSIKEMKGHHRHHINNYINKF